MNTESDAEFGSSRTSGAALRNLLDRMSDHRNKIGGFRAKANLERGMAQRIADQLARKMGSVAFLAVHVILFVLWFAINLHAISFMQPFDTFPFGLLTMVLTLEQSLLTIFIIVSQNRSSDLAELRSEMDLQINVLAEEEISKALHLLRVIGEKMNISEIANDAELRVMETALDHEAMEKETLRELGQKLEKIATATQWTQAS